MQKEHSITVTVFPFEDLSDQKELGIFCRAFSEDLETELSRFRQLSVVKFPHHFLQGDAQQLLESLKFGYFVQGTFRSEKQTIRLNVQLYDSENRRLVWGNRLEGELNDVNDLQDNLLKSVVTVLQQQIDHDLLSKIKQRPKVAFNAYEHWLYGMEELKKGSLEADVKAREHFEKALEIQPEYALAYTGMSLSYFNEWTCQLWDRWDLSKSGAFEWAQKAVELDDQNHIIAMVLGRIYVYEGSYSTAEYYFRRSLMLNSNDPDTLFSITLYFVYMGLGKESKELYEKGVLMNPFYKVNHLRIGIFIYFELGEYEKAASVITHHHKGKAMIADTDAYCAAIYYHLNQYDKMQFYWNAFLDVYRKLMSKGEDFDQQEAIDWLLKLNPHKQQTNMEAFLRFISKGQFENYPVKAKDTGNKEIVVESHFVKESGTWKNHVRRRDPPNAGTERFLRHPKNA
ncbi:MAG: hypothetical protein IT270_02360 [Saprospiraceae bacterium]|nr:hypothetical protein [Saprospiraceae bacterium]